ncbi:MAG: twin-arginine translocation signal domain-containing protein [Terriglobia bacterium]
MGTKQNRRRFLKNVGAVAGAAALGSSESEEAGIAVPQAEAEAKAAPIVQDTDSAIDFRYSPLAWQTAFCFPDDPRKSLVGECGELRCGHPGADGKGLHWFSEVVGFSVLGMEHDRVQYQRLEGLGVPIVHTRIDRPEGFVELTTFATNMPEEGRVDNVILDVVAATEKEVHAVPQIIIKSESPLTLREVAGISVLSKGSQPFLMVAKPLLPEDAGYKTMYRLPAGAATSGSPLRYFVRLPQDGQDVQKLSANLDHPDKLLAAAREYWEGWSPLGQKVTWSQPERYGEFLAACARNILQARELKGGRLNFQVGPTVYRGLWVVDGHFLLEAARYLGYDAEAQEGLEATWAWQRADGGVFAAVQLEHWKDTGIAMFSLVRQAELGQDWSYFRKMQPNVLRAVKFLVDLRDKAKSAGGVMGGYGLLPPGFGDGGLGGVRPEFTNTLWVLAGLKAVTEAADRQRMSGFEDTKRFYGELRSAFLTAAQREMRQHPGGFSYLPMLMKEDAQWSAPDEWDRPRPQGAQWALSHAIYPGLVFEKDDPIVKGHIALMQACTQEDVPIETGWIPHQGLWTYNAPFVAHVYLWADLADWARRTFIGFLNHASPLYCWREEQPTRGSLVSDYVGDMPHNWASAECIIFLRHMLALEDGSSLRLLEGVGDFELAPGMAHRITESPTRFGRVSLNLEPAGGASSWRLSFDRGTGPNPAMVSLPSTLGSKYKLVDVKGATFQPAGAKVTVQPESTSWQAVWKA